jgi:hypothetical protein
VRNQENEMRMFERKKLWKKVLAVFGKKAKVYLQIDIMLLLPERRG